MLRKAAMSEARECDPNVLHPETEAAVEQFASALKAKLVRAQQKYGHSTGWKYEDWRETCQSELTRHVAKGDPLDVAAYALFCWARGWTTCARSDGSDLMSSPGRIASTNAIRAGSARVLGGEA